MFNSPYYCWTSYLSPELKFVDDSLDYRELYKITPPYKEQDIHWYTRIESIKRLPDNSFWDLIHTMFESPDDPVELAYIPIHYPIRRADAYYILHRNNRRYEKNREEMKKRIEVRSGNDYDEQLKHLDTSRATLAGYRLDRSKVYKCLGCCKDKRDRGPWWQIDHYNGQIRINGYNQQVHEDILKLWIKADDERNYRESTPQSRALERQLQLTKQQYEEKLASEKNRIEQEVYDHYQIKLDILRSRLP